MILVSVKNAISRTQGNFAEVGENLRKGKGRVREEENRKLVVLNVLSKLVAVM